VRPPPYLDDGRICRGAPGGGGGGGDRTTTTETIVPDWVQAQLTQNMGMANTLASQPYTPYPGQTLAGFTPDQLASFQAIESLQGVAPGQIQSAYDSAANLPATVSGLLNPNLPGAENTLYQNAMRNLALTNQQTQAQFAGAGALGGTREAVQLGANESAAQAGIGAGINSLASTAWNNATMAALQGAGLQGTLATAGMTEALQSAGALGAVGTAGQTLQQAQYADALAQWQAQQNYPYQQLAILQSALAGSPYGASVTSSQPYSSNPLASALGTAASVIPAVAAIPGAIKGATAAGTWLGGLFGGASAVPAAAGSIGVEDAALGTALAGGADVAAGAGAADAAATGAAAAGAGKSAAEAAPVVLAAA